MAAALPASSAANDPTASVGDCGASVCDAAADPCVASAARSAAAPSALLALLVPCSLPGFAAGPRARSAATATGAGRGAPLAANEARNAAALANAEAAAGDAVATGSITKSLSSWLQLSDATRLASGAVARSGPERTRDGRGGGSDHGLLGSGGGCIAWKKGMLGAVEPATAGGAKGPLGALPTVPWMAAPALN
jgi:hypothetical protein